MNTLTAKILAEMIAYAATGGEVIPMFFQPGRGTSNSVSAAIRIALKTGQLVKCEELDGMGKPKYRAPAPVIPAATHIGTGVIQ